MENETRGQEIRKRTDRMASNNYTLRHFGFPVLPVGGLHQGEVLFACFGVQLDQVEVSLRWL
jgi:hypothetical protein